jgi:integrase
VAFLEYLDDQSFTNLEDVGPKVITAYITAEAERGLKSHGYVSAIKTFFDWMLAEGRRKAPNPVINHIHRVRGNWGPPRPYSDSEMALLSRLIEERGSPMLKLAFAIGEECGLRVSEVNNIRLEDVDEVEQRIYVRTPNKTDTPRRPFYDQKVKRYLSEWMKMRDPHCGHRFLLHKRNSMPLKEVAHLQTELKKILTAGLLYETGVDRFLYHRLRHTWATRLADAGTDIAVIMELGGWKSLAGVSRYIRISDRRKEESYRTAMRKLREERELGSETSVSIADLAAMDADEPATPSQSAA